VKITIILKSIKKIAEHEIPDVTNNKLCIYNYNMNIMPLIELIGHGVIKAIRTYLEYINLIVTTNLI